ncbi:MAG: DUF294 nucleotidyltransferase-like domain-containing protein [Thermodesulfobacteriota bacterium]
MNIPLDKAKAFLKTVPPFNTLPVEVQAEAAGGLLIEFFPRGEVFIRAGEKPLAFLYLIYKGAVRVFSKTGRQETLLDMRAEGDSLGSASLLQNLPPEYNAAAQEDTICYLVKREVLLSLVERFPQFRALASQVLTSVQQEPTEIEALYYTPVQDLLKRPPIFCRPNLTIRQAAGLMSRQQVGSMVVVDESGRPIGIFTNKDLRRLVASPGADPENPVAAIMRPQVISVEIEALAFEALMIMTRKNVHHLPVLDSGRLRGIVTQHDLLLLSGRNPLSVVKDIETAPSLNQLSLVQYGVDRLAAAQVRQNLPADRIQDVITLLNDRLMRRLVELSLTEMEAEGRGPAPLAWAWVASGSAGRKEQVLRTDHDCAIIYADPPSGREDQVQSYFLYLAERVIGGLEKCGFPRCREGNMANNPRWCQPVGVWRGYFQNWLRAADPDVLKSAALFFDGRFLYGREDLVIEVMRLVRRELLENRSFLVRLATATLSEKPPLGVFRQFVVEKSGQHGRRLDIKRRGLLPLVNAVRLLSLEKRLPLTNTRDRLLALGQSGALDDQLAREAAEAFNYLLMMRLRNYVEGLTKDRFSFDYFSPELLDAVQRRALKRALGVISRLQETIAGRFGL